MSLEIFLKLLSIFTPPLLVGGWTCNVQVVGEWGRRMTLKLKIPFLLRDGCPLASLALRGARADLRAAARAGFGPWPSLL